MGYLLLFCACAALECRASAKEQFLEIEGKVEYTCYPSVESWEQKIVFSFVCVTGTNVWRIDNDFSRGGELSWFYDRTNIYRRIVVTKPPPPELALNVRTKLGLRVAPFDPTRSNATVTVWTSADGQPAGDAGVNIPWLAFCSGRFLKAPNRVIAVPLERIEHDPYAYACDDKVEVFNDELGLPKRIDLFNVQSLLERSVTNRTFLGNHDVAIWRRQWGGVPDGSLRFHYAVTESTNVLGCSYPMKFDFLVNDVRNGSEGNPRVIGHCTAALIRPCGPPDGVLEANKAQMIIDRRFLGAHKGVQSLMYQCTNAFLPPMDEAFLQGRLKARIKGTSAAGDGD